VRQDGGKPSTLMKAMGPRVALASPPAFRADCSTNCANNLSIDHAFGACTKVLSTSGAFILVIEGSNACDCPTRLTLYRMIMAEFVSAPVTTNFRLSTTYRARFRHIVHHAPEVWLGYVIDKCSPFSSMYVIRIEY
jgi:hypothetical protein